MLGRGTLHHWRWRNSVDRSFLIWSARSASCLHSRSPSVSSQPRASQTLCSEISYHNQSIHKHPALKSFSMNILCTKTVLWSHIFNHSFHKYCALKSFIITQGLDAKNFLYRLIGIFFSLLFTNTVFWNQINVDSPESCCFCCRSWGGGRRTVWCWVWGSWRSGQHPPQLKTWHKWYYHIYKVQQAMCYSVVLTLTLNMCVTLLLPKWKCQFWMIINEVPTFRD